MDRFSKRHGFSTIIKEIVTREDAPLGLRQYLVQTLYDLGYGPKELRAIVCHSLRVAPDNNNWSEFPNIDYEIRQLIDDCPWYKVYDLIEAIYSKIVRKEDFATEINEYFNENGIGWKLEKGHIVFRGDESFENDLKKAEIVLAAGNLNTARNEIREAIADLSRKPEPDITGAVQHGVACLECVAREVTGEHSETLGAIIKRNRGIIPATIETIVEKIWGFSSEQGRHLKEGHAPSYEEAELMVGLSASISTFLARKSAGLKKSPNSIDTDF